MLQEMKDAWKGYREKVYPGHISEFQRKSLIITFLAGWLSGMHNDEMQCYLACKAMKHIVGDPNWWPGNDWA